jgi:hypothetical protein
MNLHQGLGSRLGALELNAATAALHDAALEMTIIAGPVGPTHPFGGLVCRHIEALGDAALEATVIAAPQPHVTGIAGAPMCRHIEALGDAALEESAREMGPSTIPPHMCRRIDDAALEESAREMGPPSFNPVSLGCRHGDDGALEALGLALAPQVSRHINPGCPFGSETGDDGALEHSAERHLAVGPTLHPMACRHIEDGALEATVIAGPSPYSGIPGRPMCRHIDDEALEASLQMGPTSTGRGRCFP